ncbi:hypothetical protein [Streptomyces griseosporeus]|uniref:hypothetical protein n=1 Tax=Streptomyces griseosporeus TaxID=1910 RepID=UPI0036F544EF
MSSWFDERRADKAVDAEQRRKDREFEAQLRREEVREQKKERREEEAQRRRDKAARRQARAARREKTLTPGNVYRRGTLALVTASALASLPAQVMHFVSVSWMLLPLPFALEGAAWVMNAGVAYADERKLPAWVRWLLRVLAMAAAGYAASINYSYGMEKAPAVGYGLAAVTMLGPLFFEVRQWVTTLTFDPAERKRRAEAKARAQHERKRRKDHANVVKLAHQLVSAAPFGTLLFEDAFAAAWEIKYGTRIPGMTPALHGEKLASSKALAEAMDAANGAPVSTRGRLLELLHPAPSPLLSAPGSSQVENQIPPASGKPSSGPQAAPKTGPRTRPVPPRRRKGDTAPYHPLAKVAAADTARKVAAVNGHHH